MKHIVLTGGGTAGHVTPNIAMIPRLKELGYKISYIGSYEGMEESSLKNLTFLTMEFLPVNYAVTLMSKILLIRSEL